MSGEMEDDDEPMLYLIFHGGYARVVGEDDNWSVAYQMAGDMGRLFAAARDLLEASKLSIALEDEDAHEFDTRWKQQRRMVRDAVAKAEGRESNE